MRAETFTRHWAVNVRVTSWCRRIAIVLLASTVTTAGTRSLAQETHDDAVIADLLKLSAPAPDWREHLKQRRITPEPPPDSNAGFSATSKRGVIGGPSGRCQGCAARASFSAGT